MPSKKEKKMKGWKAKLLYKLWIFLGFPDWSHITAIGDLGKCSPKKYD